MTCEHKRIRCTNCEFFCIDCGARLEPPGTMEVPKPTKKKGGKAK